jgi:hypothetical protein
MVNPDSLTTPRLLLYGLSVSEEFAPGAEGKQRIC